MGPPRASAESVFSVAEQRLRSHPAGFRLLDQAAWSDQLAVARFRLENGLTVVLCRDLRAELFTYDTWFRVGSKHDQPRSGIAHLLEHLMFKGTARFPEGVFDRELEERGGESNAATSLDWTMYTNVLAALDDHLPRVVELEANRMMGLRFSEEAFRSELDVVRNERRMNVDDSVWATLGEILYREMFPKRAYGAPTIGWNDDLESMNVRDVVEFYRRYYTPKNAVVVVAGAIDVRDTLELIGSHYGALESVGECPSVSSQYVAQHTMKRVTTSFPTIAPTIALGFRVPSAAHPEVLALSAALEVLVTGDNGRLYRRLVTDSGLAAEVDGVVVPMAEAGVMEFSVTLREGASVHEAIASIDAVLEDLPDSLSGEDIEKAHSGLLLDHYDALEDATGVADALGQAEVVLDDYREVLRVPERLESLTLESVRTCCRRYLRPETMTVAVAEPSVC